MRLHTKLDALEVRAALQRAQSRGLVTWDVDMTVFTPRRSQTHDHGYEIQLGTYDKFSLPAGYKDQYGKTMHVRRYRNSNHGDAEWAATWHEWGWFMKEVFDADPSARWGGLTGWGYRDLEDFNRKTEGAFE